MSGPVRLLRDFDAAARAFPVWSNAVIRHAREPAGKAFFSTLPACDLDEWVDYQEDDSRFSNCTNFAYHRNTQDRLQPGNLAVLCRDVRVSETTTPFPRFIRNVTQNAVLDGLYPIGGDLLSCVRYGAPAALFFREADNHRNNDYHWFALKAIFDQRSGTLRPAWAHKVGYDSAEDCSHQKGNIFAVAKEYGYYHFAGYFIVPQQIMIF